MKIEKCPPFCKYASYRKTYQTPKVWVSGFPSVNRNRILASVIMKKLKNGYHFVNMHHREKFKLLTTHPPKFGSLVL